MAELVAFLGCLGVLELLAFLGGLAFLGNRLVLVGRAGSSHRSFRLRRWQLRRQLLKTPICMLVNGEEFRSLSNTKRHQEAE